MCRRVPVRSHAVNDEDRYRKSSNYPPGAYLDFGFLYRGLFEGKLKNFLSVCHIPVEIALLINHFFDATHTSNRVFLRDR